MSLSILNVSLCDPVASLVGISIGGLKISRSKSVSGTLAAGLAGGVGAFIYSSVCKVEVDLFKCF